MADTPTIPSQDELVAIMEREEQASAPAPAPDPAPAPAATAPAGDVPPATAAATPSPLSLTDDALVVDPLDGQAKAWKDIKGGLLRQADYTRKTQQIAEERRAIEAERQRLMAEAQKVQAELAAAQSKVKIAGLPELPEDDPYAQRIAYQQQQVEAMNAAMQAMQAQIAQRQQESEIAASRLALEAEETRMKTAHGFGDREVNMVEQEYLRRVTGGEMVSLDQVAQEFVSWQKSLKESAINEWKTQHKVETPAAKSAAPAAGVAPPKIDIRSESFIDMIKGALGA